MPEPVLHHVGFAVASIENAIQQFCSSLGARQLTGEIHDPLQRAYVAFIQPSAGDRVQIELVAPADPASPLTAFVERGGGLHHVCYEVDDLDAQLADARARKSVVIRKPKPAVAFEGRRIAWIVTREKLVIEYLERGLPPAPVT
jgi:methylmalonyl-CoA/ethylmalonyl-CoA epimerase